MKISDKAVIKNLQEGQTCFISLSEGSGAEIHRHEAGFDLYEIPQYGNYPFYVDFYPLSQADKMIETINKWT